MSDNEPDFRAVFEDSPDSLALLLPDPPRFTVLARNRTCAAPKPAAVLGGLFEGDLDPRGGDPALLRAALERAIATRATQTTPIERFEIAASDGAMRTLFFTTRCEPVLSSTGEVRYLIHRTADVTAIVMDAGIEEELLAARAELEAFTYSVSHDLRAPLRAIDGFTQALVDAENALDDRSKNYLVRIGTNAKRMGRLIGDLLELSRIARAKLAVVDVDLTALARSVVAKLSHAHPQRNVTVDIAPGLVTKGDRRLLEIAFAHLIGNAWKFTSGRDDARVEVGSRPSDPGAPPTFFVADNGAGFDMKYVHRLFAPFQRLHRDDEFEGSGVGLAATHRVIVRHRGRIWTEATVDGGATFFFTLAPVDG